MPVEGEQPGETVTSQADIAAPGRARWPLPQSEPWGFASQSSQFADTGKSTAICDLKDGVVCYLSKPVDDNHLERCLHSALRLGTPIEENS